MLKTEDEASQVRCQESFSSPPVKSDGQSAYVAMFCLGTDCMAWRWGEDESEMVSRLISSGPPEGRGWVKVEGRETQYPDYQWWSRPRGDGRRGYCGKVGRAG